MINIHSWELSALPRAQIDKRFGDVNICRCELLSGYCLEILFDSGGYPLLKQSVIQQISEFYSRRFIPISVDGELAFANVIARRGS